METLTPPVLRAVQEIRWHIAAGHAMREAVRQYLDAHHDEFTLRLREQWALQRQAGTPRASRFTTLYQRALWNLIERGCAGQPVLDALGALETEVERAASAELEAHLATLPFKVLLPLLLFQFPAHLILLLGPLLRELNRSLGSG